MGGIFSQRSTELVEKNFVSASFVLFFFLGAAVVVMAGGGLCCVFVRTTLGRAEAAISRRSVGRIERFRSAVPGVSCYVSARK